MKIVQIEPLGITDEQLKSLVEKLENNGDEYILLTIVVKMIQINSLNG